MTGFILCLYKESGRDDIGVFTFFANRTRPEMENIIGMFATGNHIRVKIVDSDSFHQCVEKVSESLNEAIMNQELMIEPPKSHAIKSLYDLVASRPVTCELLNNTECVPFSGLNVERVYVSRTKSEYALRTFVVDSGNSISLMFQYNLDLFDGADIRNIAIRTENIIKKIIINPFSAISSLREL